MLTTGRTLEHYQSGNQTRRVASLAAAVPEPRLEIHPDTAQRWGIADGDLTEVRSTTGCALARAVLSTTIRPDTVFVPFHFAGPLAVNRVVESRTDPVSGMPDFKATPVSVRVAAAERPGRVPSSRKDPR
ncbi:molybdopterin dinucleotide binding domain-containing protein [Raineyella fluvialis]|uniref:molybdopterin dinucleotide binding domain-containing protein n=1 Tax=Raineyella fluvialis TaxID=2662261 RepID=UPI001E61AD05|nr:molybdopterin dinucleotide binding domain-containing protein [Raineyella fluvialis]